jgi:hypothetical protein
VSVTVFFLCLLHAAGWQGIIVCCRGGLPSSPGTGGITPATNYLCFTHFQFHYVLAR